MGSAAHGAGVGGQASGVDGRHGQLGLALCLSGGLCGGGAVHLCGGAVHLPCGGAPAPTDWGPVWGPRSILNCCLWLCACRHIRVWGRPGLRFGELGANRPHWGLWRAGWRLRVGRSVRRTQPLCWAAWETAERGVGTREPRSLWSDPHSLTDSCMRVRCKQAISGWQAISSTPWWLC